MIGPIDEHAPMTADAAAPLVAYFSMEYGLHEEFPSYAGGLGVLAGDFMKSAGDHGRPVVGIGLRWAQGYTAQRIGPDGYPVVRTKLLKSTATSSMAPMKALNQSVSRPV